MDGSGKAAKIQLEHLFTDVAARFGREGLETPFCSRPTDGAAGFLFYLDALSKCMIIL